MSEQLQVIQNLTERTILRVVGNDAELYLNGQVSQEVKLASETTAVYSIVANFKGKLDGDCYLRRHDGDLLIDACSSQRESLFQRLDKYLIADDAEIIDVSDELNFCHVIGSCDHDFPSAGWHCERYGVPGIDHILGASDILPHSSADSEQKCEQLRISNKIPLWGKELDENTLPPEASLEARAISYTKGCYTGQEVISRMKSAGKTNRHLVSFQSDLEMTTPIDLVVTSNDEGKPAATITSSCELDGKWIGLGYRTRKADTVSEFYDADGNKFTVI